MGGSTQRWSGPRRALAPALALLLALLPGTASASTGPLEMVSSRHLDSRLVELTLRTPALVQDPTHVRVLLPDGYRAARGRYPVLYLLHGGNGGYADWTTPGQGDAERLTAGRRLIVVMPDAGRGGWYTDWYNRGAFGPPEWETYHVDQLVPWIDHHYRTVAARRGRALAGLSMGGFGALSYAARHPDVFGAAAGFSGAVDLNQPDALGAGQLLDAIATLDGGEPGSLFGPRESDDVRWRAHNPWDLAVNLRGVSLTLRTGNGEAGGPFGGGGRGESPPFERLVHPENVSLHKRLAGLGIRHTFEDYGAGGHTWPYWNRDLRRTLPALMATLRHPAAPPSPFTFTAVESRYGVYGWRVAVARRALEFSTLRRASARGFAMAGSGVATVTTPGRYRAGRAYRVTERGAFGTALRRQRADRGGRLRIRVALGPANPAQERFSFVPDGAPLPATRVFTTTVAIRSARR